MRANAKPQAATPKAANSRSPTRPLPPEDSSVQACQVESQIGQLTLRLETGKIARQAHGAVVVRLGDTVTLTAAVEGKADPNKGFFPLVVDYRERTSAAGKFPGGFINRAGRATTEANLHVPLVCRPVRAP